MKDMDFNATTWVNVFYIGKEPVLREVDEALKYHVAPWRTFLFTERLWGALQLRWLYIHLCFLVVIAHDADKK